jgi:hypothetical protein
VTSLNLRFNLGMVARLVTPFLAQLRRVAEIHDPSVRLFQPLVEEVDGVLDSSIAHALAVMLALL